MVVNTEQSKVTSKFFFVNPEKCIGCNLCEYACSLKKTSDFNPLKSRIRIVRLHPFVNLALVCKLCDDPPCVAACPRNALTQDKETRVIRVDDKKCDGCSWCIEACPYGAVRYEPEIMSVVICDLCDGEPECKEICPVEAIEFTVSDEAITNAWTAAYQKLVDEARKVLRMAERRDLDIFKESTDTIEKIDEKLRQLFEKQKK